MERLTRDQRLQSLRAAIRGRIRIPPVRGPALRAALIAAGCITPDRHRACVECPFETDDVGCIEAAQTIFLQEEPEIAHEALASADTDPRVARELRALFTLSDFDVKALAMAQRAKRRVWRELFPTEPTSEVEATMEDYMDAGWAP